MNRKPSANGATYHPLGSTPAALAVRALHERVPANATANNTPGPVDPKTIPWGPWARDQLGRDGYLPAINGRYTGTTDEILEWAAAKWGLDPNWVKAEAVIESSGHQSQLGDANESYGILQVKVGSPASSNNYWGGYPLVQKSTALNADFVCCYLRWVFDGHFYDYGGSNVQAIANAHGWDYVMWGAVGSWYSGEWYTADAVQYINQVKTSLAANAWAKVK